MKHAFFLLASVPLVACSLLISSNELTGGEADASSEATTDAGKDGVSEAVADVVADVALDGGTQDTSLTEAGTPSPCMSATFDRCYDFTTADVFSGWTFITSGTTFDATHFTRHQADFVSAPACMRYRHPSTNYSYLDTLRTTVQESGKNYYLAFSVKVERFGTGQQLGLVALALGNGTVGDVYFYQKNGSYFMATRYHDGANYQVGPQSADFQITTQDQWHRYEIIVTKGSPSTLKFGIDGNLRAGLGLKYETNLNNFFQPNFPTISVGLWDHNSTPNAGSERVVYFDDIVLDVTP